MKKSNWIKKVTKMFVMVLLAQVIFISVHASCNEGIKTEQKIDDIISNGNTIDEISAVLKGDNGKILPVHVYVSKKVDDNMPYTDRLTLSNKEAYKQEELEYALELDYKAFRYTSILEDEAWDQSGGVKAWGKLSFDTYKGSVLVKKFEGTWTNYDAPGSTLSNQHVTMATIGKSTKSGLWVNQWKKVPVNSSFTVYSYFTDPVDPSYGGGSAGGTSEVTIKRPNGSSWKLYLTFNVFDTMPDPIK